MAIRRSKKVTETKLDLPEAPTEEVEVPPTPVRGLAPSRLTPTTSEDFLRALNTAVANVQSLFQLRDNLLQEIGELKQELQLSQAVKIEREQLATAKRELEAFEYECAMKRERRARELEEMEEEKKTRLAQQEDEHKERLKSQIETQVLKLKLEREDHERRLRLEREDLQRQMAQFASDRAAFETTTKRFEEEKSRLRESLIHDLARDHAHQRELAELTAQKVLESAKAELKLEQVNRAKFEMLLTESHGQNEKLAAQLVDLSREALVSASSASMATKLRELVGQMASGPSKGA